jgi:hypothetical protein
MFPLETTNIMITDRHIQISGFLGKVSTSSSSVCLALCPSRVIDLGFRRLFTIDRAVRPQGLLRFLVDRSRIMGCRYLAEAVISICNFAASNVNRSCPALFNLSSVGSLVSRFWDTRAMRHGSVAAASHSEKSKRWWRSSTVYNVVYMTMCPYRSDEYMEWHIKYSILQ